jgi:hypothetical protein
MDRTDWIRQKRDRTSGKGQLGEDIRDRSDRTSRSDRSPCTGKRGENDQEIKIFAKRIVSRKCLGKPKMYVTF